MYIKTNQAKTKLQVVAVPIGNLKELTPRAIEALTNAETILCEDTRVTLKLLSAFDIKNKKLISFQKFNENQKLYLALECIKNTKTVLVSDAGYPCISDPGFGLINACHKQQIAVEVINGSSSIMHALCASGININNFYFHGFLNANKKQRLLKLKELVNIEVPIIFFESVHRIVDMLLDIKNILDDPDLIVARELTKLNETFYFGKADEVIKELTIKGEFVVIVQKMAKKTTSLTQDEILKKLFLMSEKIKPKLACKKLAEEINDLNYSSNVLYSLYLDNKKIT